MENNIADALKTLLEALPDNVAAEALAELQKGQGKVKQPC